MEKYWEGLPIGTGRFAAMIGGNIKYEKIFFNDETLWSGGPYNPNYPDGMMGMLRACVQGVGLWLISSGKIVKESIFI